MGKVYCMVRGYSGPMEEIGSKYEERSAMHILQEKIIKQQIVKRLKCKEEIGSKYEERSATQFE